MRLAIISGYIGGLILLTVLICYRPGWCGEWIQINPSFLDEKGEVGRSFQEAVFDANHIYVITSDSTDPENTKDPNRETCLWVSKIAQDPNKWAWEEAPAAGVFREEGARLDKLFSGAGFVYIGLYNEETAQVYKLLDPNRKQQVAITAQAQNNTVKWRVDNAEIFGNKIYLAIYERDYGFRVLSGDLVLSHDTDQIVEDELIQIKDLDVLEVSLLEDAGGQLFLGTRKERPASSLYYYKPDAYMWKSFGADDFIDPIYAPNESENIVAFLSAAEFLERPWLLTESWDGARRGWALWESEPSSSNLSQWTGRFSSKDESGPFADPNVLSISGLVPMGEYLYLGCIFNDKGEIWKNYLGEKWIPVPSAVFDPNNLLGGIFNNPNDLDHIYAGTQNSKGAQILVRLVPRIELCGFSLENRFIGPEKQMIRISFKPNWEDPNYWQDPNNVPAASLISFQGIHGESTVFDTPDQVDPQADPNNNGILIWDFSPYMSKEEGVYTMQWELTYGDDKEPVIKHLALAWDSHAPSVPKGVHTIAGDCRIKVQWESSTDNFEQGSEFADANFRQSLKEYELIYWRKDEPEHDTNIAIPISCLDDQLFSYIIDEGLENDVQYEIRIRARDKADNVSEYSEPVEVTPRKTKGWTDLVNEKGGCFIYTPSSKKQGTLESKSKWIAGIKGGFYEPRSDEAEMVYGGEQLWPVHLEIGWVHRPYLEVGFSVGYMQMDGMALQAETLEPSADPLTFQMIPCSMSLRWLPFQDPDRILVPYLGAGVDAWWYQEKKRKQKDTDGWNYGYHGVFGLRLLIDSFDFKHARRMSEDYGVKHTYLTLEAAYNWIDDFGDSRLDLGGLQFQAGILFLF